VFAADFRDRIVHHLLVTQHEPCSSPGSFTIRTRGEEGLDGASHFKKAAPTSSCGHRGERNGAPQMRTLRKLVEGGARPGRRCGKPSLIHAGSGGARAPGATADLSRGGSRWGSGGAGPDRRPDRAARGR
jgi:hypothetical protein